MCMIVCKLNCFQLPFLLFSDPRAHLIRKTFNEINSKGQLKEDKTLVV